MQVSQPTAFIKKLNNANDRIAWFVANFVSGVDQGQVCLYKRAQDNSRMALVRQDYVGKAASLHVIENPDDPYYGRSYKSWADCIGESTINSRAELFYTPNTFYGKPSEENLCSLRACFIDIDCHGPSFFGPNETKPVLSHIAEELWWAFIFDNTPVKPTIVNSGRGLHLMFRIEDERADKLEVWKSVQRKLADYVSALLETIAVPKGLRFEVDRNALNPSRLLRVPGSYNGNAGSWSRILVASKEQGTLSKLAEYFGENETERNRSYANPCGNRLSALLEVANKRDWKMTGLRHIFLTIFGGDLANQDYEEETICEELVKINSMFTEPLRESELDYIARTCVSRKYHYSDKGIINYLGLDEEEAALFPVEFSMDDSPAKRGYMAILAGRKDTRTKNKSRNKVYRQRKDKKFQNYIQFAMLRKQGYSADDIAMRFFCSARTVKTYWGMTPSDVYAALYHKAMSQEEENAAFVLLAAIRKKKQTLTERARLLIRLCKKENNLGKTLKKKTGENVILNILETSEKSVLEVIQERILGPCKNCAIV